MSTAKTNQLILENLRIAEIQAKKALGRSRVNYNTERILEDLRSAGYVGLIQAAQRFDGRGDFFRYASKNVREEIIDEQRRVTRLNKRLQKRKKRINEAKDRLTQKMEREDLCDWEVAEEIDISVEELREANSVSTTHYISDLPRLSNLKEPILPEEMLDARELELKGWKTNRDTFQTEFETRDTYSFVTRYFPRLTPTEQVVLGIQYARSIEGLEKTLQKIDAPKEKKQTILAKYVKCLNIGRTKSRGVFTNQDIANLMGWEPACSSIIRKRAIHKLRKFLRKTELAEYLT